MKEKKLNNEVVWPTESPIVVRNFLQTGVDLLKEKIGALSQNPNNPLSRVCVANSCFSLEPVRGCPLSCAYCIAGNDCRNLIIDENSYHKNITEIDRGKLIPRIPEMLFPGEVLAETMINHPGFVKDKSIVSVAIGSSEAFLPGVEQETWAAMKYLADHGYMNPFWFAVKLGITDPLIGRWLKRFRFLKKKGIKIAISVSESNAPAWLEPYRGDRFRNLEKVKEAGVHITHHLRPVIRGITDSTESLSSALNKSLKISESVCIGGLRIDPGIVLLWKHINGKDPNLLPKFTDTEKGLPPRKDLPENVITKVKKLIKKKGYKTPVFTRSSHILSYAFDIPDVNLYKYRVEDDSVFLRISLTIQSSVKMKQGKEIVEAFREIAGSIGLPMIRFKAEAEKIFVKQRLNYQEHHLLIHAISHSGVLPD
ncbi:hypothetical protein HYU89_00610 [Candidatus Collierbacteria bacterium]|nr:hypothetical protein [Candidatus Collierbacteria bacterium]